MGESLREQALKIAEAAHHGQKRRNGENYIEHPKRVAGMVSGDREVVLALLHDVLEDTPITQEGLREAGIPENVMAPLVWLTRNKGENYFNYIMRIKNSGHNEIILVKLADLDDNLRDLEEGSMKDKYRFAQYVLKLPIEGGW